MTLLQENELLSPSFKDMEKLCDRLLEVCNKNAEPSKNHSMDKICRGLIRLTNLRYLFCPAYRSTSGLHIVVGC